MGHAASALLDRRLAVDIGGTFTDVAISIGDDFVTTKTPTTPADPVAGAMEGIDLALRRANLGAGDIRAVIHGTTLATNALIERKGATVATITTAGFRDVLEIGYERRYDQYDLLIDKPEMLVPRHWSYTVPERLAASGEELVALDESAVEEIAVSLKSEGIDSVAVCLLHSYANGAHEQRIGELLQARLPDLWVSLSSEVSPEMREYDRLCTTVANAYVKPLMARYLQRLEHDLDEQGFVCPLFVITSGGGMTTLDTAARFPIRLVESGPSGGAILAAKIAKQLHLDEVISFDMGGTTAKVCLIDRGEPQTSRHFEIARAARFVKGSGLPVRIPVIDMIEIGAGGGSIAAVDQLARVTIGPESAGAEPGPASYGRGGSRPTVTDADLVLGYLDPHRFADGRFALDRQRALDAISDGVADPLALPVELGASAITQMVDENMANAARVHAVERAKRLETRTMIAFGGNGPLHATRLAEKLGVERIVVPPNPGVGSAVGFLDAPVSYEVVRSHYTRLAALDADAINELLETMEHEATTTVRLGSPDGALETRRLAFMRYVGQGHEIEALVPPGRLGHAAGVQMRSGYERRYAEMYGRHVPDMEIEILNWAVIVSTRQWHPPEVLNGYKRRPAVATRFRPGHIGRSAELVELPSFERDGLDCGDEIKGPALIVEAQTTTYVGPGFDAEVDGAGNLILARTTSTRG